MRVALGWCVIATACGGLAPGRDGGVGTTMPVQVVLDLEAAVPAVPRQGFLYFGSDVDAGQLASVSPAFWRTSVFGTSEALTAFTTVGATVSYVLSDAWSLAHQTHPWDDWAAWERFVEQAVSTATTKRIPIVWWDVWNEPEATFGGTQAQLAETLARAARVIRRLDPSAKVVGPSMAGLSAQTFNTVLNLAAVVADAGAPLDAISFHTFGQPTEVRGFAQQARDFFAVTPWLCRPTCPQLHVNEYSSGQHDHVPGWALAWLAAFETERIDWVTKACWNLPSGQSGCGVGLGGLLLPDGSPQATWFVHEGWARLTTRVVQRAADVTVVAGRDAQGNPLVLIGRHTCGQRNRWCTFADHPVDDAPAAPRSVRVDLGLTQPSVTASRVGRAAPNSAAPALAPASVPVVDGGFTVVVEDGEVWRVAVP